MMQRKDLFDFMLRKIKQTADSSGDRLPQAFGRWFANMYFGRVNDISIVDGSGDGKVDLIVSCIKGSRVKYHILNTKFTNEYDKSSPVSFYDEITRFWQAFENKASRGEYLGKVVRNDLKKHYSKWFKYYDDGDASLFFVTNHKRNENQYSAVKNLKVDIYHLEDVLQYLTEHIEGAMPETDPLLLTGISNVLTPSTCESEVPTSIVFARLIDFIKYMEVDPFELLFARNVRLWLGNTETNKEIQKTFKNAPDEFAYCNNGITLLCKKHTHDPGKQELLLENPRVVNGSQTLHSIRYVEKPSTNARVMVRIIQIPSDALDLPKQVARKKEILHKISIRSNMQNPIKRWNLVSNDDFQNELSRYFWSKSLYYERRQYEWRHRRNELRALGIKQGPDIRWMTQLIASYHYDKKSLGPAIAHGQLNELFEEEPYRIIRETQPELAYQLYLLVGYIYFYIQNLKNKRKYIQSIASYIELCLFAYVCRVFKQYNHFKWGNEEFTAILEKDDEDNSKQWEIFLKDCIDVIVADYEKESKKAWKKNEVDLTAANYFKSRSYITPLFSRPIPRPVSIAFKKVYENF